jgi:hypothetical protein
MLCNERTSTSTIDTVIILHHYHGLCWGKYRCYKKENLKGGNRKKKEGKNWQEIWEKI